MKHYTIYQMRAVILGLFLLLLLVGSMLLLLPGHISARTTIYADIYQNGKLLQSINLTSVTEDYTFSVTDDAGNSNEILVCPGRIAVSSASCPDKLCVRQGYLSTSRLPITCLPNRLVIQLRQEFRNEDAVDAVTY